MNAGVGSWLLGMALGAGTLGGTLGMASGIFTVLAATTFASAVLYAISGFGFAVLAAPLFLLFLDPAQAVQLVIIISTVLSTVVLRGLLPAIAPWLLLRLALGSFVGLPLGLAAFNVFCADVAAQICAASIWRRGWRSPLPRHGADVRRVVLRVPSTGTAARCHPASHRGWAAAIRRTTATDRPAAASYFTNSNTRRCSSSSTRISLRSSCISAP